MRASEFAYERLSEFQPAAPHYSSFTLGADGYAYTVSVDPSQNGGQQLLSVNAEGFIETVLIFGIDNDLKNVQPWLVKGPDGSLYGGASKSTPTPHPIIFRRTPAGLIEEVGNGSFLAPPVFGGDGALYGCTASAGISRLRTDGVMETVPGSEATRPANGVIRVLVAAPDGSLYFPTSQKLWKIDVDGVLSEVARFDFESPTYSTLGYSLAENLVRGKSGTLYGMSGGGGPEERGVIFKITPSGTVEPVVAFGSEPGRIDNSATSSLDLAEGTAGTLYYVANPDFSQGYPVFAIDAAGSVTMIGALPITFGQATFQPPALVTGSDDEVYAALCVGGVAGKRTIFKISIATGCTVVAESPELVFLDGEDVQSPPIIGPDGGVWALSSRIFGLDGFAHLMRLRPDGTFEEPPLVSGNVLPGRNPTDLRPLSDGSLVGVAGRGGPDMSALFKVQPDGSIRFVTEVEGALEAPVELDDGSLVGTSLTSGFGFGSIYCVEPNGRQSVVYFSGGFGSLPGFPTIDGKYPDGPPVRGADGAWYGLTRGSGFGLGTIYKVTLPFNVEWIYASFGFDPVDTSVPMGPFVDGQDGALYAITVNGGAVGWGGLIRFVPNEFGGGDVSVVANFPEPIAPQFPLPSSSPAPKLVLGSDGWFYGVTNYNSGFVFRVNKTGAFEVMARFTGETGTLPGYNPRPFLTLAADGFFYGVTESGGTHNAGTVFRVNPAGRVVNIASFTGTTGRIAGANPTALIRRGDVLYGACAKGGASDVGTLFRIDKGRYVTVLETLTGLSGAAPGGATNSLTLGADGNIYGTGGPDALAGANSPLGVYGTVFRLEIADPPCASSNR